MNHLNAATPTLTLKTVISGSPVDHFSVVVMARAISHGVEDERESEDQLQRQCKLCIEVGLESEMWCR